MGPIEPQDAPLVHIGRFGVISKSHQPGKRQFIVDLSHPRGYSVNDGIQPELCLLTYTSVDKVEQKVLGLGTGIEMAKFDMESGTHTPG